MARLVLENIDVEIVEQLERLARKTGNTIEQEARLILLKELVISSDDYGFGTKFSAYFRGIGMDFQIPGDEVDEEMALAK